MGTAGVSDRLRGPAVDLAAGPYFTCLGAAQTHGTFVESEGARHRLCLPCTNRAGEVSPYAL